MKEAFTFSANISYYPLLNELVYVFRALNRWYYLTKFNTSNRVTSQAIFGLNNQLGPIKSDALDSKQKTEIAGGGSELHENPEARENRLGRDFVDLSNVYRLRHQEGDVVLEGRSGHSIRFGSNQEEEQAPNLLIRVGPNPDPELSIDDSDFAIVNEDINKDLSSIWIVSNQVVPLTFATVDSDTHFKSMEEKPGTLSGNQLIANSDRIVLNTKRDKLLVSTFLGTHFTTLQEHTVDTAKNYRSFAGLNREIETGQDYVITVTRDYLLSVGRNKTSKIEGFTVHESEGNHSIMGSKIFIGSLEDDEQPIVLGEQLRQFLDEFINIFVQNSTSFTLPTVGVGPLNPAVLGQISELRARYKLSSSSGAQSDPGFLSKTNFVSRG